MSSFKLVRYKNNVINGSPVNDNDIEHIFTITNFVNFSYDISSPVTPTPLPEETVEENILIKLEGNSGKIKLSWIMKDLDVSPVNNDSNVLTMLQQMLFFKNRMVPKSIADSFTLVFIPDNSDEIRGNNFLFWDGTIGNVKITTSENRPVTFNATLDFFEGSVTAAHDLDKPPQPRNVSVTSGSDSVSVTWDTPLLDDDESPTAWHITLTNSTGTTFRRTLSASARSDSFPNIRNDTYVVTLRIQLDNGILGRVYKSEDVTVGNG